MTNFEGGKSITLTAADNGILLPMETSKFEKFDQATYDKLFQGLVDGSIKVENDTVAASATDVPAENVKVELSSNGIPQNGEPIDLITKKAVAQVSGAACFPK